MSVIADLPDLRPSLLLDFANSGRVDPRIQCTRASSATCFGPDGKLRTVAANVPRIDYDPMTGKCLGLLVEESRSNLFSGSAQPVTAMTTRSGIAGGTTSEIVPFSGAIASFMEETATTGGHYMERTIGNAASAPMSFSVYVKAVGRKDVWLSLYSNSYADFVHGLFDLTAKTSSVLVGSSASGAVAQIAEVSPGWFRLSITATPSAQAVTDLKVRISIINLSTTYAGEVGKGFLTFGAQVEAGASPTSYIPTEASAVTRAADTAQLQGAQAVAPWLNISQGTLLARSRAFQSKRKQSTIAALTDGSAANRVVLRGDTSASQGVGGFVVASSVDSLPPAYTPLQPTTGVSVAISYATNSAASSAYGQILGTSFSGQPPQGIDRLVLGNCPSAGSAENFNGHISLVAYYPVRITNEHLQRLTA